jgi:hypothetical protein
MTRESIRFPAGRRVRVSRSDRALTVIYTRADLYRAFIVGLVVGIALACIVIALLV